MCASGPKGEEPYTHLLSCHTQSRNKRKIYIYIMFQLADVINSIKTTINMHIVHFVFVLAHDASAPN